MTKTIVFVHGAWVTPKCWDNFKSYFESQGYNCILPAWPHKDGSVEQQQQSPDPGLKGLGIKQIVDNYDQIIRALPEPPILIGHSFGGLFVQMLLDRGLGAAGVAIDPAPPKGVNPFLFPTTIRSNLWILLTLGGWNKILHMSQANFNYSFVNNMPTDAQKRAYDNYVVPETGRIFFESALAMVNNVTKVNFANSQRAPLLITASSQDQNVPAGLNKANFRKYEQSSAITAFREFPGRSHWVIAQDGWQEVAEYINAWLGGLNQPKA